MIDFYCSIDIETDGPIMGTHSLLSIGAEMYRARDLQQMGTFEVNLELHGISDADTMDFWSKNQSAYDECRKFTKPVKEAINSFVHWTDNYHGIKCCVAWPTWFDYGWVRQYCLKYAGKDPFNRSICDFNQQALAAGIKMPKVKNKTPHVALADAVEQGTRFVQFMKEYRKLKLPLE